MDTILLVEGDLHQQLLYSEELHDEGWQVICVTSAKEALDVAATNPIDCVVLDVKLPQLDGGKDLSALLDDDDGENGNGMSLLCQMREHWPQLPIIVYTTQALVEAHEAQKAIAKRGANACLLKNGDPAKLVAAVHAVLERATEHRVAAEQMRQMTSPLSTNSGRNTIPSVSVTSPALRTHPHPDMRVDPYQDPGYNVP